MGEVDVSGFVRGDESAMREAIRVYSPHLKAVVWSFATDPDDAKDLLQETWVRAYQKRESYDGEGSLLAWLIVVCRNVCITLARVRSSRSSILPRVIAELQHSGSSTPAESLAYFDSERLTRAIAQLPARQRAALTLRLIEGRSTRETAIAMNCAEGSVKAHLHHALKSMRTLLEEKQHELPGR